MRDHVMKTDPPITFCAIHASPNRGYVVLKNGKNAAAVTLMQTRAQKTAGLKLPCSALWCTGICFLHWRKTNALCDMQLNLYGRQKNIPPFINSLLIGKTIKCLCHPVAVPGQQERL
jgi:hypothetical protein